MSDRTLYLWKNAGEGGPWVDTDKMRQELIEDDVLVPMEPVGYINVRESGFISREQDIEPGRYVLFPLEADDA